MPEDYRMNDHLADADRWLESRPVCDCCGNPIQDEIKYEIDNETVCPNCIMNWLKQFEVSIPF